LKRSRKIGLLVLGTAVLMTGCSSADSDNEMRQQRYASKADCERDWETPRFKDGCKSSGGGAYMGPRYYWNHGAGVPVAVMADGTHRQMRADAVSRSSLTRPSHSSSAIGKSSSVSRGGFGGFGRGSGGG